MDHTLGLQLAQHRRELQRMRSLEGQLRHGDHGDLPSCWSRTCYRKGSTELSALSKPSGSNAVVRRSIARICECKFPFEILMRYAHHVDGDLYDFAAGEREGGLVAARYA